LIEKKRQKSRKTKERQQKESLVGGAQISTRKIRVSINTFRAFVLSS